MNGEIKSTADIHGCVTASCVVGSVTVSASNGPDYPKYDGKYIVIDHPFEPSDG